MTTDTNTTDLVWLGYSTPIEKQEIYVPAVVWDGCYYACGSGPTVSVEEAYSLGAIPGTANLETGKAEWPQSFWEKPSYDEE